MNITYPLFRRKVYKSESFTVELLFKHPDCLVLIVTRYILYLISYARVFNISPNYIIDTIFPKNVVQIDMKTTELQSDIKLDSINIIIRSNIILDSISKPENDKYSVTTLEIDVNHNYYNISQICYDNNNDFMAKTAKILFNKEFRLASDGTLVNPNYIFNKELLEDDLMHYRLMISQLMIFLGSILDTTTTIYFIDKKKNDYIL